MHTRSVIDMRIEGKTDILTSLYKLADMDANTRLDVLNTLPDEVIDKFALSFSIISWDRAEIDRSASLNAPCRL